MDFQRTPGPIGDPFLDTVHRRHPDVDIVVLPDAPPDAGAAVPVLPVDADAARVERADAGSRLTALWLALHEDPDDADPSRVSARLAPGPAAGTVVATAQATTKLDAATPDGRRMMSRLAAALDGVERREGPVERLVAATDGASVRATYAESTGVLVVVLTGPVLGVGTAAAHALVGEA